MQTDVTYSTSKRKKRNPVTAFQCGSNWLLSKPRIKSRAKKLTDGIPPPCTECDKSFPSWKSLFGHMRSHPERDWRGIHPPNQRSSVAKHQLEPVEVEVASCLVLLSNGPARIGHETGVTNKTVTLSTVEDTYVMNSSPDVVGPLCLDLNILPTVITEEAKSDDDKSCDFLP